NNSNPREGEGVPGGGFVWGGEWGEPGTPSGNGGLGYQSLPLWGRHSVTEKREGRVGGEGHQTRPPRAVPLGRDDQGEDVKTETTAASSPIAIVRRMSQNSRLFITEPP